MSYRRLGDMVKFISNKNTDGNATVLFGINIDKFFMPSVANIIGVDLKKYKLVKKYQFACNRMHVGRDERLPISMSTFDYDFIVSPAYDVFEVTSSDVLPEYLMLWFRRKEFDRQCWFYTDADVRGGLHLDALKSIEIKVPSIEEQRQIVAQYQSIANKIKVNEQICEKLEAAAQALYKHIINLSEVKITYRLGDLIEIKGGFSYNSESLGKGNTYLLGMGCVSFTERFVESGMRLYSDDIPSTHIVKSKDIIIATRQQSENMPILGFPAMIPSSLKEKRLVIASNLYRVVNKSNLSNELIYQILKSDDYQNRIKEQTKGTTVGMITKDAIEDFIFEAPEIEILISQQEKINTIVSQIFCKKEETQKLTQLQSLLLSRLGRK
ncbi:restriction endonuclease subunit S [Chryseobacterium gambrini]|uniref:restriction endonuclease subunit S n=1 Tax=Chryseobacterium gambrini TaxID=373672 RepID=UPI0022F3BE57|nr:restriction endonuclease subunit S [Chryseobacterium gambrini]WBX97645.1 restriction endonuclease subunit S [Chryseobacterium gambrini]